MSCYSVLQPPARPGSNFAEARCNLAIGTSLSAENIRRRACCMKAHEDKFWACTGSCSCLLAADQHSLDLPLLKRLLSILLSWRRTKSSMPCIALHSFAITCHRVVLTCLGQVLVLCQLPSQLLRVSQHRVHAPQAILASAFTVLGLARDTGRQGIASLQKAKP